MAVKIGIISFEHMHAFAYVHAFKDLAHAELVAAAESDPERSKQVEKQFNIPKMYSDWRELLKHPGLDAVIVTTANADHAEITVAAAKAGKHIMCEKPLATTVDDCLKMIRAARDNGVLLMTAFPVRFSPSIVEARKSIKAGSLGRIAGACTSNHGSMPGGWFIEPERSGGGAVVDHTVHVADLLRWMFEDEVEEVYAEYDTRIHDIECDDVGQVMMRFRSGKFASLDTSWSRPESFPTWGDVKLEIKGDQGNLSVNCFPRSIHLYDGKSPRHTSSSPGDDIDMLMVSEFASAILEKRQPLITGEDGLRAVEITLAAYEAGKAKRPVKVNLAKV